MRGAEGGERVEGGGTGTIPAHAGSSCWSEVFGVAPWDHPGACGEQRSSTAPDGQSIANEQEAAKVGDYGLEVPAEFDAQERAERQRVGAAEDTAKEKQRLSNLLAGIEEDA
ncbi:hypothetical protein [Streptomyces zaomyceticus]|uniref:hypothetical protein n=1 Tax=Streptomyces zaomyceticus TaxID=68286 RepID=UPI0036D1FBA5